MLIVSLINKTSYLFDDSVVNFGCIKFLFLCPRILNIYIKEKKKKIVIIGYSLIFMYWPLDAQEIKVYLKICFELIKKIEKT